MRIIKLYCCCVLILCPFFSHTAPPGKLIVFAGISGSGKSSMTKELSTILNVAYFLEPEEKDWPPYIKDKAPYGEFSAFSVFRAMRISALWQAWNVRNEGKIAISDSYYDKITGFYLGKPGMEWLLPPDDPYFECAKRLCELDEALLPNADCIVLMDIPFQDWLKMLNSRGRIRDDIEGFRDNYELYSSYIRNAVFHLAASHGIKVVVFNQQFSDVHTQSILLYNQLVHESVIKAKGTTP